MFLGMQVCPAHWEPWLLHGAAPPPSAEVANAGRRAPGDTCLSVPSSEHQRPLPVGGTRGSSERSSRCTAGGWPGQIHPPVPTCPEPSLSSVPNASRLAPCGCKGKCTGPCPLSGLGALGLLRQRCHIHSSLGVSPSPFLLSELFL